VEETKINQHQLFISSIRLWQKLKRQNKIDTPYQSMFRKIWWFSFLTAPFRYWQKLIYTRKIKQVKFEDQPPVFVIGHWRSGTTHLHYLLTLDKRFSYLENFQAFFFRVAFVSKWLMRPILNKFMPETRPQDNVKITANSPSEEEHPLTNLTEKSGMHSFFFPQNMSYFNKYNLFEEVSQKELKSWKSTYHWLLQNIAYYSGENKQLLLKNPHSTARIKVLLTMYPKAQFIHIHRHPYDVYKSTVHLYKTTIKTQFLQTFSEEEIHERVLYSYEKTMRQFILQKTLVPASNFIEMSYDELLSEPIATLEKIYAQLNWIGFEEVKPDIITYLREQGAYERNKFSSLPSEIKEEINQRWGFFFDAYGYEKY
jgi:omega-hydroxy-beta-dihydromenaquinone-9 sulfotransferase